jgi:hypothetical protein
VADDSEPDIDSNELAREFIDGGGLGGTGLNTFCIRNKQCARAITCEHAHADKRGGSVKIEDLFQGKAADLSDCENWTPRRELNTELDVPRRRSGSGSRHNAHAPDRTRAREAMGYKGIPDLTKGTGQLKDAFSPQNGGRLLPQPPDLKVKRHIRKGFNINRDED